MEMYWSGFGGFQIARRTGIPVGTIYSWIHDFGGQREREILPILPKPIKKKPIKERLGAAKSAEEWLLALREHTLLNGDASEELTIHLVCGTLRGQSALKLSSFIYESLNDNPQSGNIYAFCNKTRTAIATFTWKYPVFHITKHVKMHGTFIWPHEDLGKTIEVTKAEFDRLLFLNKQEILADRIAKSLAIMRV